jgi:uncharacterized protein (DUF433 family)
MTDSKIDTALADAVRECSLPTAWSRHPSLMDRHHGKSSFLPWSKDLERVKNVKLMEWHIECTFLGEDLIEQSVDATPTKRGGRAVLKGTGFTVSQTLVELANSSGVTEVADNFDLNADTIRTMLNGLAMMLSKPFVR